MKKNSKIYPYFLLISVVSCAPHNHYYQNIDNDKATLEVFCTPNIKTFRYRNQEAPDSVYLVSKIFQNDVRSLMSNKSELHSFDLKINDEIFHKGVKNDTIIIEFITEGIKNKNRFIIKYDTRIK